ncbi:HD domain protein [Candidatus Burarchaeum australiense]|nr:HD domain protein [Candidatus Burarchaeum australiense]
MTASDNALVDYLFSLGMLKRTERSGWRTIGVRKPESVAEHSFVAALVGAELARSEGADEAKVMRLCLLHDLHELRMSDLNLMNKLYVKRDEKKAFADAVKGAGGESEMRTLFSEFCAGRSREAVLARDADALEMMLEAKFLVDTGNPYAKDWIASAWTKLRSAISKRLARGIDARESMEWVLSPFRRARGRKNKKV